MERMRTIPVLFMQKIYESDLSEATPKHALSPAGTLIAVNQALTKWKVIASDGLFALNDQKDFTDSPCLQARLRAKNQVEPCSPDE